MNKEVSFQLDQKGGEDILQNLAAPLVKIAADAIAARAASMASSMSSDPPQISVTNEVGIIRRGTRAIATVTATGPDKHSAYIGAMAIRKSKDAGRVT